MAKTTMNNCDTLCKPMQVLRHLVLRSSMKSMRFAIAVSSLTFALLLWWPGQLFIPSRTTYRIMAEVASENTWGVLFFVHFLFAARTLLWCSYTRLTFAGDAVLGAVLWTMATVACFASHWQHGVPYAPPAAMSAEVGVLLASWWYLIRWVARK